MGDYSRYMAESASSEMRGAAIAIAQDAYTVRLIIETSCHQHN